MTIMIDIFHSLKPVTDTKKYIGGLDWLSMDGLSFNLICMKKLIFFLKFHVDLYNCEPF